MEHPLTQSHDVNHAPWCDPRLQTFQCLSILDHVITLTLNDNVRINLVAFCQTLNWSTWFFANSLTASSLINTRNHSGALLVFNYKTSFDEPQGSVRECEGEATVSSGAFSVFLLLTIDAWITFSAYLRNALCIFLISVLYSSWQLLNRSANTYK